MDPPFAGTAVFTSSNTELAAAALMLQKYLVKFKTWLKHNRCRADQTSQQLNI